jgi:hypothetical protein
MNSNKIARLVKASYVNNKLDEKIVNKIASLISRSDLKKYIDGLKLSEKKKTLIVSSSSDNQDVKKLKELFPHKKIIIKKDPSLMLGIRIVDNDIAYEFTLKNTLDKIVEHIEQSYD